MSESLLKRMSLEDRVAVVRYLFPEAEEAELEAHLQKLEKIILWSEGEGRAEVKASYERSLQEKKEREEQEAEREASFQRYLQALREQAGA